MHGTYKNFPFFIEPWIDGKQLVSGKLTNKEIDGLASFYTTLASQVISSEKSDRLKTMQYWNERTQYWHRTVERWHNQTSLVPHDIIATMQRVETLLLKDLQNHSTLLPRQLWTLRHGDSNLRNFFMTKKGILAIDWIDACGPLCLDTADLLQKANMTKAQEQRFLKQLPKWLAEATVAVRPMRLYTLAWWNVEQALLQLVERKPTLDSSQKNLNLARKRLKKVELLCTKK